MAQPGGLMETPNVPLNFVPAKAGDVLSLGKITIRIMEDGSRTGKKTSQQLYLISINLTPCSDNRIGAAEFTVPAKTPGPPPHWHEMVNLPRH